MRLLERLKIKVVAAFALVLSMTVSLASACLPLNTGATYVKLDKEEITLYVGETSMLSVETDGFGKRWSSDDEDIATVDDGEITAVAVGETTITVSVGKLSASCDVTVLEKSVTPDPEEEPKEEPKEDPDDPYPVKSGNLCETYENYFVIGAAVQSGKLTGTSYGNLMSHFNSISPENNMKWKNIESSEGVYNFNQSGDSADKLISWAKSNGVGVRGHCLLWYKSLPTWLHDKFDGLSYSQAVKTSAYSYIDKHIEAVMEHFGDDVYVWDVVNEALYNAVSADNLNTSSSYPYGNIWRTNDNMSASDSEWVDWYKVTGGYEYIAHAFQKAAEVRTANNLNMELYYNDYGLNDSNKRQAALNLLQMLRDSDAPIDGIGMQAHYKLDDYTADRANWIKNFEASVKAFIEAGVDVQITELDIRFDGALTEQREADQAEMYGKIFEVARKYAKTEGVIHGVTGVTIWGVNDGCNEAWGKNQYPLVFGTDKAPKEAYYAIINFPESSKPTQPDPETSEGPTYQLNPGGNDDGNGDNVRANAGKWAYMVVNYTEDNTTINKAEMENGTLTVSFTKMESSGDYYLRYSPDLEVGTNYKIIFDLVINRTGTELISPRNNDSSKLQKLDTTAGEMLHVEFEHTVASNDLFQIKINIKDATEDNPITLVISNIVITAL